MPMCPEEFLDHCNQLAPGSPDVQTALGRVHTAMMALGSAVGAEMDGFDGEYSYRIELQREDDSPEVWHFCTDRFIRSGQP